MFNVLVHVFVAITVGFSHCDFGKSFVVWVLLLGSCPVFCLVCCLSDETQIWPGDLRVVCGWFFVVFCLVGFAAAHMTTVSCADFYSTDASSHVRTEPSSDIGQTREKKVLDPTAKETCLKKGQKWTPLKSKVVPPGGSRFVPFIVANLLKRLCQVEADFTSNSCDWNFELGRPVFARLLFVTF